MSGGPTKTAWRMLECLVTHYDFLLFVSYGNFPLSSGHVCLKGRSTSFGFFTHSFFFYVRLNWPCDFKPGCHFFSTLYDSDTE